MYIDIVTALFQALQKIRPPVVITQPFYDQISQFWVT